MSASYLIFDFAGNEDAAQQARQRIENWQRGFRLGNKLTLQFDRGDAAAGAVEGLDAKSASGIRMIVRVDFSDHEKRSRQRWLERIPADDLFEPAKVQKISPGDSAYAEIEEKFTGAASGATRRNSSSSAPVRLGG